MINGLAGLATIWTVVAIRRMATDGNAIVPIDNNGK